ncbi:MAG: c-type cytochrome [Roseinatronobacter sp.]
MKRILAPFLGFLVAFPAHAQDIRGHGGPVGALAMSGTQVLSGSFDTRAILWDAQDAAARKITRVHSGNVTAVAFLPQGGFVTAGQDGRIAVWDGHSPDPRLLTDEGLSAIAALAVSPDGAQLAAGFWDGRIARMDVQSGALEFFDAHAGRVTGLAILPDGALASTGHDLRLSIWGPDLNLQERTDLPDLPNGMAISEDRLAVIFAEGALRLFDRTGALLPERFLTDRPLVALAAHGADVAAAAIDGTVWVLEGQALRQRASFRAVTGPVWSLALDDQTILAGGADGTIRRFASADGTALGGTEQTDLTALADTSHGAQVWRACAVCHSLEPDDLSRAGPSLHGIFGRPIATAEGYDYSPDLRALSIIWTPQTVAELFEFGPEAYTPGSRMPEQRVTDPEDRAALIDYLQRHAMQ